MIFSAEWWDDLSEAKRRALITAAVFGTFVVAGSSIYLTYYAIVTAPPF